jgi:hypothetical protein
MRLMTSLTTFCLKTPQTTRINTDFVNFWNKPIMKITFCLVVGLVTGIMLPLRSNASENQVPQTPVVGPINSIQASPQSSPTGFNERLSDTSNTSETMSGSGKSTKTLSDTSQPSVSQPSVIDSESSQSPKTVSDSPGSPINAGSTQPDSKSVTPATTEEKTEAPTTTNPKPKTDVSESGKTTTETTTKPTGASSQTEQMNNKNSSPAVIKNGQMSEKTDDDKADTPATSSKTTSPITTPKTNKTTKTVPSVKTGEW